MVVTVWTSLKSSNQSRLDNLCKSSSLFDFKSKRYWYCLYHPLSVNVELKDVMEYDEAHYFGINNKIVLGGVITEMTESSNPTESEKQYIHQKSKTTN